MRRTTAENGSGKSRGLMRLLALGCALLLLFSTLPLYAIAFYNHPYYDDYNFSQAVHDVWQQTHSLPQVLTAAWTSAQNVYATWQGTYTGTLLSNLQPGVFGETLYWLTTFLLLTAFLLCFGFLFHTLLRRVMGASRAQSLCAASLALFLMIQFLPSVSEAFYWFNGGVGNTLIYAFIALDGALSIRLYGARRGAAWLTAALFALSTLLGGGSYGGGLLWLLLSIGIVVFAFIRKNKYRFVFAALTAWFALCFVYNITAPGNEVRAAMIGASPSALKAVAQALYYGVALLGNYFTLPVAAVALGLAPMLWQLAAKSRFSFPHPALMLLGGAALFCAQLTPPLYAGVFLGGDRTIDTYYFSFIVLLLMSETYLLGALARRRERLGSVLALPASANRGVLLLSACLFLVGCLGYKPAGATLYGPMNMAGGSAALSLFSGEAANYDREMDARELLLNDATQPTVTLKPLTAVPDVFMDDLLSPDATDNVLPTLKNYYHKDAILVEGGDAS
jgi:hypothetical protein